jgi:hypothetical protein
MVINPKTMTTWCSGCAVGVTSSGPRWTPPTVDSITVTKVIRPRLWRKDKPVQIFNPRIPERYIERDGKMIDTFTIVRPIPNRPIVLRPVTHTPEGVVTEFGNLVPDAWHSFNRITPGRAIAKALGQYTKTSLDQRRFDDDGNEIEFEPERSVTMNLPSDTDEIQETVALSEHDGPARSFVERVLAHHHKPELISMVPATFSDKSLGFKSRADALFALAIVQCLTSSPPDPGENWTYNERLAALIRRHAAQYRPLVGQGAFVSDSETVAVRERLAGMTPDSVRRFRERMANLGILS